MARFSGLRGLAHGIFIIIIMVNLSQFVYGGPGHLPTTFYTEELHLFRDLTARYISAVRPVENASQPVIVNLTVTALSVQEFDEKTQTLAVTMWLKMLWSDPHLRFDPSNYGQVDSIPLSALKLWTPDIAIFDGQDSDPSLPKTGRVHVTHTGDVLWTPYVHVRVHCDVSSYRHFPYDSHYCKIRLGSLAHSSNLVDVSLFESRSNKTNGVGSEQAKLADISPTNVEWDVADHVLLRNELFYTCCPNPYIRMSMNLTLRRKPGCHIHMFVAPSIVLAIVTPALFVLPAEMSGRMALGAGLLITQGVLLHMIEAVIPVSHSQMPLIALYVISNLTLVAVALIVTSVTSNLWLTPRLGRPPAVCRWLFLSVFGRLLCVRNDGYSTLSEPSMSMRKLEDSSGEVDSVDGPEDKIKMVESQRKCQALCEWRHLATVIDRLFLLLYSVVIAVCTVCMFPGYSQN